MAPLQDASTRASPTAVPASTSARHPVQIPILAESAATGGCGQCHHGDDAPVCAAPQRVDAPVLSGSASELGRVEQALLACSELGGAGLASGVIQSVHAQAGEVELRLLVGSCGAGARLLHAVFDHLRSVMPDTDIYVLPSA